MGRDQKISDDNLYHMLAHEDGLDHHDGTLGSWIMLIQVLYANGILDRESAFGVLQAAHREYLYGLLDNYDQSTRYGRYDD